MAFGRSNSLSINTGSGSSLFGNDAQSNQPQPAQQPTGSLFGNTASTSQPQQSGGLFGNNNNNSSAPTAQLSGGGLFGSTATSSQPQQGGSLFGAPHAQGQQQSGSLFGGMGQQNNQAQNQQAQTGTGGGLFGGLGTQNKPAMGSSLFGGSTAQQPTNNTQQSSFGASLFNPTASTAAPLVGSLTMGQGNAQQQIVPGTKIDLSNLRPTTRFSDLHDDLKKQIEAIDSFIRQQESYSAQCEALLPNHSTNVDSIKPDVDFVAGKLETVELALENDSRAIDSAKALVKRDAADLMRCARVTENLTLPSQYHYGPSVNTAARTRASTTSADDDSYDVDLVAYFMRQADAMQTTLDTYTSNLAEIENHLRVIEVGTVQQAQQLAAQRTGSRAVNAQNNVRELAETLRGFENAILGAAGLVGSCREGVNELILGRIGGDARQSQGFGNRSTARF
ncbi:hypothetical protein AAFC00_006902 [Neodothiora populina]|uniref:Nucleoporin NUP49/NSP49 n=1 Tax=Neodothiora populina TaxID=2781224 RepID=A0ABR3PBJ2_9PEZI